MAGQKRKITVEIEIDVGGKHCGDECPLMGARDCRLFDRGGYKRLRDPACFNAEVKVEPKKSEQKKWEYQNYLLYPKIMQTSTHLKKIRENINDLGVDRWELVVIDDGCAWFKRLIEEK